jgi:hypothetical protein
MDIGVAIARYGRTGETYPRYAIIAFRDLHPPFTADYLLRDWRSYIPVSSTLESKLVLEREIDGVRFRCHRAPSQRDTSPWRGKRSDGARGSAATKRGSCSTASRQRSTGPSNSRNRYAIA